MYFNKMQATQLASKPAADRSSRSRQTSRSSATSSGKLLSGSGLEVGGKLDLGGGDDDDRCNSRCGYVSGV